MFSSRLAPQSGLLFMLSMAIDLTGQDMYFHVEAIEANSADAALQKHLELKSNG